MFTSASIGQDLSICLRCQYRIAARRRPKSGRRNRLSSTTFTRPMVSAHRVLQSESQTKAFEEAHEESLSPAQDSNGVRPRPKVWNTYSTANLEMNALGEPAKIIMVPKGKKTYFFEPENAENTFENQNTNMSPTGILESIQEKPSLVDSKEAYINIEKLRTSWLSQSQNGYSILPKPDYLQLLDSLKDGFTLDQLVSYYEAKMANLQESGFELAHPRSATLYTRSSWEPGCSPFPGKAAEHLRYLRHQRLEEVSDVDEKESIPKAVGKFKPAVPTKSGVATRIIQVLWNVQVPEEVGELNMWIVPLYLGILLSDRKNTFHRITETYGAKVDVSRSRRIIRITSYKTTCSDIFKSILQTLENIKGADFYLPSVPSKKSSPLSGEPTELEESLVKKIALDTGTIIQKVPDSTLKRKGFARQYRIFYISPDEDGLVRAKEELIEASRFPTSYLPSVLWDQKECSQGRPRPVEVGSAMPMVAREKEWSRWASPIKRNPDVALDGKSPDVSRVCSVALRRSVFNILFPSTTSSSFIHPESYQSSSWGGSLERKTFATLGQVLYPSEHLKALSHMLESKIVSLRSSTISSILFSRRQLFGSFPSLRSMLQNSNPGTQVGEDLRIRLRPSPEFLMEKGDKRMFPDVELRIKCDSATKTCEFSSARLMLDRQEVDLLLPTQMVDIRFASTSHILSGAKTDLEILSFLSSSNIDEVFAQAALTFPDTANLSIPAHLVRKPPLSKAALTKKPAARESEKSPSQDPFVEGTPDIDVKYTLSHYEHWSYMSGDIAGLDFQYAVITSSGKTRKREEFRVALNGGDGEEEEEREEGGEGAVAVGGWKPDPAAFMTNFDILSVMIERLKNIKHHPRSREANGNIAASLVPSDM